MGFLRTLICAPRSGRPRVTPNHPTHRTPPPTHRRPEPADRGRAHRHLARGADDPTPARPTSRGRREPRRRSPAADGAVNGTDGHRACSPNVDQSTRTDVQQDERRQVDTTQRSTTKSEGAAASPLPPSTPAALRAARSASLSAAVHPRDHVERRVGAVSPPPGVPVAVTSAVMIHWPGRGRRVREARLEDPSDVGAAGSNSAPPPISVHATGQDVMIWLIGPRRAVSVFPSSPGRRPAPSSRRPGARSRDVAPVGR